MTFPAILEEINFSFGSQSSPIIKSILERIYVTTVHKAKGLEFDNVIIFDAADGRYPNAYNKTKQQDEEDARKFYVAMSRAKRRLFIAYALQKVDRLGSTLMLVVKGDSLC